MGLLHVNNPLFGFTWLLSQQLAANVVGLRFEGALDTALDTTHVRYRLGATWRTLGPRPDQLTHDGSYFDLHAGVTEQRYVQSGFVSDSVELSATGRLDLARVGPTLRGSFAELSTGIANTDHRISSLYWATSRAPSVRFKTSIVESPLSLMSIS